MLRNYSMKSASAFFAMLLFCITGSFAQSLSISGSVSERDGIPLTGANVIEMGTTNGTVTDLEGKFILKVNGPESKIQISFMGFITHEFVVGDQKNVQVKLMPNAHALDEMVVIGYGVQSKADLTAAVSTLDVAEASKGVFQDATTALQGRTPGLNVVTGGGVVGQDVKVQIRGAGSLSNTNPLYIIDGAFANSMSSLDVTDIASVEVLKDASAAAIYGSRAANGVVIVTTKAAKSGKLTVDLDATFYHQTPNNKLDFLSARDYADVVNIAADRAGVPRAPRNDSAFDPNTNVDYQDEWFQSAPIFKTNLSIAGGTEKIKARFSLGNYDQEGILINSAMNRTTARLNLNFDFNRWKSTVNVGYTHTHSSPNNEYAGHVTNGARGLTIPTFNPYDPNTPSGFGVLTADYYANGGGFTSAQGAGPLYNPLVASYNIDRAFKNDDLLASFNNSFNIFKGFTYNLNISAVSNSVHNTEFTPTWVTEVDANGQPTNDSQFNPTERTLAENWVEYNQYVVDNFVTYDRGFGKHNVGATLGTSYLENFYRMTEFQQIGGFPGNSVNTSQGAQEGVLINGREERVALFSVFGRVNYNYDQKYLFSATFRNDQSSKFAEGNQTGFFPSVSLGWNMHKEAFMQNTAFSQLKLRASYGELGANFIDPYSFNSGMALTIPAVFGNGTRVFGAIPTIANENLSWEVAKSSNFGIDFELKQGEFYGSVDVFRKDNEDLLASLAGANSSGTNTYYNAQGSAVYNSASIRNTGFEFVIGYQKNFSEDFSLNASFLGAHFKNEVTALGDNVQPIYGSGYASNFSDPATKTDVGMAVGTFWGYVVEGIDADGNFAYQDNNGTDAEGRLTGQPDGQITDADKTSLGSPLPDFEYGLNLSMRYKDFDLSMFFQGSVGNDIFNAVKHENYFNYDNALVADVMRDGDGIPAINAQSYSGLNARPNSWYVEDASYFRLKNLQVGYNLNEKVAERWKIRNARIFVGATNLLTITDYSGLDPEITMGGAPGVSNFNGQQNYLFNRGIAFRDIPRDQTFFVGIHLGL